MSGARLRLILCAVLFFGWIGWLAYLAATKSNPIVVSRAQMIAASNFVLVDVQLDPETQQPLTKQTIAEDLRPGEKPLAGSINIVNLREARIAGAKSRLFTDEGRYLLPLIRLGEDRFELAPPPKSPGNDGPSRGNPWAYLWQPEVEKQFNELVPKK
jgi:predicted membrane metal-binding protein